MDLINWFFKSDQVEIKNKTQLINKYRILLSFNKPESAKALLILADSLTHKRQANSEITAMHFLPTDELHHYDTEVYETESFKDVIEQSKILRRNITTMFKASSDIENEIVNVANKSNHDLLLIGLGQSIYEGSLLGKILGFTTRIFNPEKFINTVIGKENKIDSLHFDEGTRQIVSKSKIPVGVFIDKNFTDTSLILIPVFDTEDWEQIVIYIQKFIYNSNAKIVVLDVEGQIMDNSPTMEKIHAIQQSTSNLTFKKKQTVEKDFLLQHGLMLISVEGWRYLINNKFSWLSDIPSTLIIADEKNKNKPK